MLYVGLFLIVVLTVSFFWGVFQTTKNTIVLVFTGLINMFKGIHEVKENTRKIDKTIKELQEQEKETSS